MTAAPKVSIGLPVFNGERYLDETIESLVSQSFEDFEIVISDNASTDQTPEICKEWVNRDPRIRYFRSDRNRGAAWNYNAVFRESRGQYFKWAAHDDVIMPEWLEECVAVLDEQTETVLAYTNVIEIDQDGEFIMHWVQYSEATSGDPVIRLRSVFSDWRCLPVFGVIRRDALLRTRLIGAYGGSDHVLLGELSVLGRFHRIDKFLFHHREHPDRYLRAHESAHDRGRWFDPKNTDSLTYWPNWQYHINFAKVVLRSPLRPHQTARALLIVMLRAIRGYRKLWGDVVAAGRAAAGKARIGN
jgi:glycosyltransferase involved in cell wall biosynthesis